MLEKLIPKNSRVLKTTRPNLSLLTNSEAGDRVTNRGAIILSVTLSYPDVHLQSDRIYVVHT